MKPETRIKLSQLANTLGISRSATLEMLIAKAEVREEVRSETAAALSVKKSNRYDAANLTSPSVTAVAA